MPFYSVIIPTYNRKVLLTKALESVLGQSFKDFELIIVDDGSNDGTNKLIREYNDPRIKYFYQGNKGVSFARNKGLKEAKGKYICFLDSDDFLDKNKLEIQKQYINDYPEIKIFHTQEIWYRNNKFLKQKEKHKKPSGMIFPMCLPLCCVSISTATIHKSVFEKIGNFDEDLPACEDYDFWLRISLQYPVHLIDKPLTIKDGGRPDQLSQTIKGLDKYRIQSLLKLSNNPTMSEDQRKIVIKELTHKIEIYSKGCIKRNKLNEAEEYLSILKNIHSDSRL